MKFKAQGVWLTGDDKLPSLLVKPFDKFDYAEAMPVSQGDIDHGFCFEPVPHANDALNRPKDSPMPEIDPGASFEASIRFRAVTSAA